MEPLSEINSIIFLDGFDLNSINKINDTSEISIIKQKILDCKSVLEYSNKMKYTPYINKSDDLMNLISNRVFKYEIIDGYIPDNSGLYITKGMKRDLDIIIKYDFKLINEICNPTTVDLVGVNLINRISMERIIVTEMSSDSKFISLLKNSKTILSKSDSKYLLGLISFYNRNFIDADAYFEAAAKLGSKVAKVHSNLAQIRKELEIGLKFEKNLKFKDAMSIYHKDYADLMTVVIGKSDNVILSSLGITGFAFDERHDLVGVSENHYGYYHLPHLMMGILGCYLNIPINKLKEIDINNILCSGDVLHLFGETDQALPYLELGAKVGNIDSISKIVKVCRERGEHNKAMSYLRMYDPTDRTGLMAEYMNQPPQDFDTSLSDDKDGSESSVSGEEI